MDQPAHALLGAGVNQCRHTSVMHAIRGLSRRILEGARTVHNCIGPCEQRKKIRSGSARQIQSHVPHRSQRGVRWMSTRPKHVMPLCRETGADGRTNQTGRANDNDAHAETSFIGYTLGRAWQCRHTSVMHAIRGLSRRILEGAAPPRALSGASRNNGLNCGKDHQRDSESGT
jgi:hypothetical protein